MEIRYSHKTPEGQLAYNVYFLRNGMTDKQVKQMLKENLESKRIKVDRIKWVYQKPCIVVTSKGKESLYIIYSCSHI